MPSWTEDPLFLHRTIFKTPVLLTFKWQKSQILKQFGKYCIGWYWKFLRDCTHCITMISLPTRKRPHPPQNSWPSNQGACIAWRRVHLEVSPSCRLKPKGIQELFYEKELRGRGLVHLPNLDFLSCKTQKTTTSDGLLWDLNCRMLRSLKSMSGPRLELPPCFRIFSLPVAPLPSPKTVICLLNQMASVAMFKKISDTDSLSCYSHPELHPPNHGFFGRNMVAFPKAQMIWRLAFRNG